MQSTINARGQITIPAVLRREMGLAAGQVVHWEKISDTECRLVFEAPAEENPDAAATGHPAKRSGLPPDRPPSRRTRSG